MKNTDKDAKLVKTLEELLRDDETFIAILKILADSREHKKPKSLVKPPSHSL